MVLRALLGTTVTVPITELHRLAEELDDQPGAGLADLPHLVGSLVEALENPRALFFTHLQGGPDIGVGSKIAGDSAVPGVISSY